MRRDRLMTGSRNSAIDFTWLLENLEIENVPYGVDGEIIDNVPTFVIGHKAIHAAEAYVLGLFHLYPTVYFHKATRGAEKLFVELMVRLVERVRDDGVCKVGLSRNHPLVEFARSPDDAEAALKLDDAVVWGSLSQLREAKDPLISAFAGRLQDRKLFKCIDVRAMVHHQISPKNPSASLHIEMTDKACAEISQRLQDLEMEKDGIPTILTDELNRSPYKRGVGSSGPLEQINIRTDGGAVIDLSQRSDVVAGLRDFKSTRAYFDRDSDESEHRIQQIIDEEVKHVLHKA